MLAPWPDGYRPKQECWTPQQRECFDKLLPARRSFLAMEPRCGKSKPIVDKTCFYYERKSHPLHVNALLVIAFPNGVHRGWVTDAFPENCPDRINWRGLIYRSNKAKQVSFKHEFNALCRHKGLAVLTINVEALSGKDCREVIGRFLKERGRVFVVFDESSALVTSDALRSRIMANIGTGPVSRYVIMMADLDGTPVDKNGPMDYYSQIGWMGHDILGYPNEVEFRHHFAELKTQGRGVFWRKVKEIKGQLDAENVVKPQLRQEVAERRAKGATYEEVVDGKKVKRRIRVGRDWWEKPVLDNEGLPRFKNMHELWDKLNPISYRATFKACFPNAKQHVYQPRYFQLSERQRAAYDQLQKEYKFELEGEIVKAEHPLTRQLRAQQIASNYYPEQDTLELHMPCGGLGCMACNETGVIEGKKPLRVIDPDNHPRLDALEQELKAGLPTVVWTRFKPDVDAIVALGARLGISTCRYDGAVSGEEKDDARDGFQSGKYDLIAGNQVSLSRGIPLWRGMLMVAYNNLFSYRIRKQIEDRTRHGAKTTATGLVDIIAEETVDDFSIIPALRAGHDVSTYVLRDERAQWI